MIWANPRSVILLIAAVYGIVTQADPALVMGALILLRLEAR